MPALHPIELWEQSGRAALFGSDALPAMVVEARGGTFVLGPTHEEVATVTVRVPDAARLKYARIYSADGEPYDAPVLTDQGAAVVPVARHATASVVVLR